MQNAPIYLFVVIAGPPALSERISLCDLLDSNSWLPFDGLTKPKTQVKHIYKRWAPHLLVIRAKIHVN